MNVISKVSKLVGLLPLGLMLLAPASYAGTLGFTKISNNTGYDLSSQLSVDYTSVTGGVEFTFTNIGSIDSSITDIYFDTGFESNLFSGFSIENQTTGVSYDTSPNPGNLPGGVDYGFYADYGGDSTSPTMANGVNNSGSLNGFVESITFLGAYGGDWTSNGFVYNTYDNFLEDLMAGVFNIGLHIQSIGGLDCSDSSDPDCGSDSYISTLNAVPVPAAAWLFGSALIGLFAAGRRKNKA